MCVGYTLESYTISPSSYIIRAFDSIGIKKKNIRGKWHDDIYMPSREILVVDKYVQANTQVMALYTLYFCAASSEFNQMGHFLGCCCCCWMIFHRWLEEFTWRAGGRRAASVKWTDWFLISYYLLLPFNRLFFLNIFFYVVSHIVSKWIMIPPQQHLPPSKIFFVNKTKGSVRMAFKKQLFWFLLNIIPSSSSIKKMQLTENGPLKSFQLQI